MPPRFLETGPATKRIRFRSCCSILASSGSSLLINNAPERDEFTIVQARLAEDVINPVRCSLRVTNCRQLIDSGRVSRSKYCAYFSILLATEMQHWQASP